MSCGCVSRSVRARTGALARTPLVSLPVRALSTSAPLLAGKSMRKFAKKDRSIVKVSDHMTREAGPPIKWTTESDFRREPPPLPASSEYSLSSAAVKNIHGIFHWPQALSSACQGLRSHAARGKDTNDDFAKPWVLRPHYYEMAQRLNKALTREPNTKADHSSYLLLGPGGTGKSHLLSFVVGHAKVQGAVVAYVPKANTLAMSRSEYVYSPSLQAWVLPKRVDDILLDLQQTNKDVLPDLKTISYPGLEFGADKPIPTLIQESVKEGVSPTRKQESLELIFRSLAAQDKVPFVFAIDEVETCFTPTEYKDPSFQTLQSWEFALQRFFVQLFKDNARSADANTELRIKKGMAIGAQSYASTPFRMAYYLLKDVHDAKAGTIWESYHRKLRPEHISHAKACEFTVFNTERPMTVPEALAFKQVTGTKLVGAMTQDDLRARLVESQGNPKRFIGALNTAMFHLGMTV